MARSPSPTPSGISTASPGLLDAEEEDEFLPLSGDGSYCTVYNASLLQDLVKDIQAEESKAKGGPSGLMDKSYRSARSGSQRGGPSPRGGGGGGGGGVTPQHSRTLEAAGSSSLSRGIPGHQNLPTRLTTEEYLQQLADGTGGRQRASKDEERRRRYNDFWARQGAQLAEMEKSRKEGIRLKKEARDKVFDRNFSILCGHCGDDHVSHRMNRLVANVEHKELQKKQKMYQEWEDQVFAPKQRAVVKAINGLDHKARGRKRREEYGKFIEAVNQKGTIFLDVLGTSFYDPMAMKSEFVQVEVPKAEDPTEKVLACVRQAAQQRELEAKVTGKILDAPKDRNALPPQQWASGKIEATPHGRHVKPVEPSDLAKKLSRSRWHPDHYKVAKGRGVADGDWHAMYGLGKMQFGDARNASSAFEGMVDERHKQFDEFQTRGGGRATIHMPFDGT